MDKFLGIINVFLEKYFIPTIAAVVPMSVLVYITPNDYSVKIVLGRDLYLILLYAVSFLLVLLVVFVVKSIINLIKASLLRSKQSKEREAELLEGLWTMVDGFSPYDRDIIQKFLENRNQPISESCFSGESLLANRELVHATDIVVTYIGNDRVTPVNKRDIPKGVGYTSLLKTQYKLSDSFYRLLKLSINKHGKISHFF